ncbi:GA module-containing protein [Mycoplasma seminis]|uniref:GA module-containing protein n=1 Tax=Mycoplasma seminis TaxID=512749 RepID=A0ABY9HBQ9_9MOLU|nr:GA module-containing protein [Mycoplasma seminis]WLP85916.1 GA module-containing protein [Mycoplasma seminis]
MSKVGKFLLVGVGGLAIGAAAVAIPSVIFKNQRTYYAEETEFNKDKSNLKVAVADSVDKNTVLASQVTKEQVIFSGYNKKLFEVSLGEGKNTVRNTPIAQLNGLAVNQSTAPVATAGVELGLESDDTKGTLTVTYMFKSKTYSDLTYVPTEKVVFTGFKLSKESATRNALLAAVANTAQPIAEAWNTTADAMKDAEKANKVKAYGKVVAEELQKHNYAVIAAVESTLPAENFAKVSAIYNQVAGKLNDVLVDAFKYATSEQAKEKAGLAAVKDFLSVEKMTAIKNDMADVLVNNKDNIASFGNAIFASLKENESTKSITTLDNFIEKMTEFFKEQIQTIADQVKAKEISTAKGHNAIVDSFKSILPELRKAAVAKAHELLPVETEYNAVKEVLKSQYEALETQAKANVELLMNKTKDLATLIDDLKALDVQRAKAAAEKAEKEKQAKIAKELADKKAELVKQLAELKNLTSAQVKLYTDKINSAKDLEEAQKAFNDAKAVNPEMNKDK